MIRLLQNSHGQLHDMMRESILVLFSLQACGDDADWYKIWSGMLQMVSSVFITVFYV